MRWKDIVKVEKIMEQNQGVIIEMNLPPLIITRLITYLYYYTLRMFILTSKQDKIFEIFRGGKLVNFLGEPIENLVEIVFTTHIYFENGKRHRWGQLVIYQTNPRTEDVINWVMKYEMES